MITAKQTILAESENQTVRKVHFLIGTHLYTIEGIWQWEIKAEEIFCSTTIFDFQNATIEGVFCLLHPDDVTSVEKEIEESINKSNCNFSFRIITTYGEVKEVKCQGYIVLKKHKEFTSHYQQNLFEKLAQEKEEKFRKKYQHLELLAYTSGEKLTNTGVYYLNTSTHEAYYSNEVFHIYGLLPQSLNAHLGTFTPFIHPQDKSTVVEILEKSYRFILPLHLEYRIITNDGIGKFIRHISSWNFNEKGENILSGVMEDITVEKTMELQLAELKDELKLKYATLQYQECQTETGSWELNILTRKTFFSDNVYRIFGLKPQVIPLNFNILTTYVHPEDKTLVTEALKKIFKENAAPDIEYRIVRKDGKIKTIRHSGKVIINSQQEMIMVGIIEDITESEAKLKYIQQSAGIWEQQKLVYEQAEEMAGMGSWTWNTETGAIHFSLGIYKLLKLKKTVLNLTLKIIEQHIHEDDKKIFTDYITATVEGKEESKFNFRIIAKGETKYINCWFRINILNETKIVTGILTDNTDLFLLKQQVNEKLLLSNLIADSAEERIIVTDINNTVLDWNKRCEMDFLIPKDEAIGENLFDIFPQLKNTEVISEYKRAIDGDVIRCKSEINTFHHEEQNRLLVPLKNDEGDVIAVINIMLDVSSRLQLQKDLNNRIRFIENLLEVSVDRIVVLDQYMNYLYWNKKAEDYYNIPKADVLGKNILEVFPAFLTDPSYGEFKLALQGKTIHIPPSENNQFSIETYIIPLKDENDFVTGLLWLVHDTSPQYQLQQFEKKSKESLNALNENYVEVDNEYRFVYLNKKAELYFNKNKKELIGSIIWEAFPAIIGSPILEAIIIAGEEKTATSGQHLSPVTGKHIRLSATPTTEGVVIVFSDIQEYKEAEDKLAMSQYFSEQVVNATPDVITVFDVINKKAVYMNSRTENIFGYAAKEMTEMGHAGRLKKIIFPEDREYVSGFIEILKSADDRTIALEYRVVHKSGKIKWIRNRGKVFKKDAAGNCTHTISILQDITDEVMLRQHLDERTRISESIFEASVDPMFVVNKSLEIIAWNNMCLKHFSFSKDMVIGRSLNDVFEPGTGLNKLFIGIKTALKGEKHYFPAEESGDSDRIVDRYFIPMFSDNGHVQTVLCVIHDLTNEFKIREELKHLNIALEKKNLELEQNNEEIMTFAFAASHDLKEPIRKIRTFNNWLQQEEIDKLSTTGKKYLLATSRSAERLDLLLKDILILSRIQSEKEKQRVIEVKDVLIKVEEEMHDQIKETHAKIYSSAEGTVFANESQLIYLFRNLISNSIKFQREGNKPVITISSTMVKGCSLNHKNAVQDYQYLHISLKDNGFGFEQKYEHKIFQIFQRLHRKEDYPGTGMGLTICKKIMEEHEGFIKAESSLGQGSVFHLFFPV